jgi:O-antigen/teichoic acid export membrane protein
MTQTPLPAPPGVARRATIYVMADLVQRVGIFAVTPLWLARLSAAEYGEYEVMRSITLGLIALSGLGLAASLPRHGPTDAPEIWRERYGTVWRTVATATTLLVVLGLSAMALPAQGFVWVPLWRETGVPVLLTAAAAALAALDNAVMVYRGRAATLSLLQSGSVLVTLALGTALLYASGLASTGLLWGFAAGALLLAVGSFVLTRSERSLRILNSEHRADALRYGIPLIPHVLAQQALVYADRYLIVAYLGAAATGIYGVAYLPASAVTILAMALNKAFTPQLYHGLAQWNSAETRAEKSTALRLVQRPLQIWMGLVMAGGVLAAQFGTALLPFVTPSEYRAATSIVALTVLGTTLHGAYLVAVNVQFFFGTTRRLAVASVGCAGLNVALNAWWLPSLELYGAALATVVAYAVLAGILWTAGVRILRGSLVHHTALTTVTALICILCAVPTWLSATIEQEPTPWRRTGHSRWWPSWTRCWCASAWRS